MSEPRTVITMEMPADAALKIARMMEDAKNGDPRAQAIVSEFGIQRIDVRMPPDAGVES